jgi:hypothetical protein
MFIKNFNQISDIKKYLKVAKETSFKLLSKYSIAAIVIALSSSALCYESCIYASKYSNTILSLFLSLSGIGFGIIGLGSSIFALLLPCLTIAMLFNVCDEDTFDINVYHENYIPIFSSESHIKQILNLLITTSLYVPAFKEKLKEKNNIQQIKECLKYNCALLNSTSFEDLPRELHNKLNSNLAFIKDFLSKCFFHINQEKLYLNEEFTTLLAQSLELKEKQTSDLEKLVFKKMNAINLDDNEKENQTLEEAKKTLSLSL